MLPILPVSECQTALLYPRVPPVAGCPQARAEQRSPFGPAPLQSLPPYYGLLRPCAPPRYSDPRGGLPLGSLPSHRGDRIVRSPPGTEPVREPEEIRLVD